MGFIFLLIMSFKSVRDAMRKGFVR